MNKFKIVPEIQMYDDVVSFLNETPLTDSDFVLISKHVYESFFKDHLHLKKVYFRSDYGQGEPNSDMVNHLIRDFKQSGCTRIIAIGGGSVMDMAKVLVVAKDDDCESLFLHPENLVHQYPLILIPTTCGSGSEVSNISIVELLSKKTKLGLAQDPLYADTAVLIPSLLSSISDFYFVTSSIDGLIHAIESYLSSRSNTYTRIFQEKAIQLYLDGFQALVKGTPKESLYEDFTKASNMAGISFANTGTGCVHGISYPLSGTYHVTHGLANSIFLVEVLKMYERDGQGKALDTLKSLMASCLHCEVHQVFNAVQHLLEQLLEIPSLKDLGMKEEEIISFSQSVIQYQQRLMSNGFINLNEKQVQEIYRNLYY